jgi:hypothetical protein
MSSSLDSELSLSEAASGDPEDNLFSVVDWGTIVGCGDSGLLIVSGLAKMDVESLG